MIKNPTYKYFVTGNTVVAVSSFAGKKVRGIAKCNPSDNFNLNFGKALASVRCELKIAKKRVRRAQRKVDEAKRQAEAANRYLTKMLKYEADAEARFNEASFKETVLLNCPFEA